MKIVIVDDDRLVCTSLKTIIETDPDLQVEATGHSGQDAVALFAASQPDVLLMDIRMDIMTGLEACEIILGQYPRAKILFLTTFADDEYIIKALKIGARGYILKQNYESIIPSLKAVASGQSVFGEEIIAKLPALIKPTGPDMAKYDITDKESEIIALVAEGLSNREIAGRLFLSEGTVRNSISVILDKLQLRNRTQLAIYYYKTLKNI